MLFRSLVKNPTFRVGWAVRNSGNTTDVSLRGASASAFIEGEMGFAGDNTGLGIVQPAITTALTNLLTIRCTSVFNNSANRNSIILSSISMTTESTKVSYVRLIKNPTVTSGFLSYEKASDLGEVAINQTGIDINSGKTIGVFSITNGEVTTAALDIANPLNPGDVLCFAGQMSSGASNDMSVTIGWQDF